MGDSTATGGRVGNADQAHDADDVVRPAIDAHIAVVCGGDSPEADVSRVSGGCVAEALARSVRRVTVHELSADLPATLQATRPDCVFPALHGGAGEDGSFQGLLKILGIPYVGSGVQASACAMDKITAKSLFRAVGLPVAPDVVVHRAEGVDAAARRVFEELGAEVVVKPAAQGSALGVSFPRNLDTLVESLTSAFEFGDQVLVERRVLGREVTVAVLDDGTPRALPVIEIKTPPGSWYDFEHRYAPGLSEHRVPAPLPEAVYNSAQAMACMAHKALGCRDFSRVDFVVPPRGGPIIIELNSLPGMTPTSLYPDAARAAGIGFETLLARFVRLALERGADDDTPPAQPMPARELTRDLIAN